MSIAPKSMLNMHAKRYIAAVYESTLREAGFACFDEHLLCWYRIRNNEVLDSVAFYATNAVLPLVIKIRYEVSPLFIRPFINKNVVLRSDWKGRHDCYLSCLNVEKDGDAIITLAPYNKDIPVYAPIRGHRGLAVLTDTVFPHFEKIQTVYDCYQMHKQYHLQVEPKYRYGYMSCEFIDEVLYVNDNEVIPYCKARTEYMIRFVSDQICAHPNNKEIKAINNHWQQLHTALSEGSVEDYLMILEQKERQNIADLKKDKNKTLAGPSPNAEL